MRSSRWLHPLSPGGGEGWGEGARATERARGGAPRVGGGGGWGVRAPGCPPPLPPGGGGGGGGGARSIERARECGFSRQGSVYASRQSGRGPGSRVERVNVTRAAPPAGGRVPSS